MNKPTRRGFLRSTAALALLGFASESRAANPVQCRIGLGTYGLPGYSLKDSLKLVADTGFDSIEIAAMPGSHGAPDQLSTQQRGELAQLLADSGLKLVALMGLPTPDASKQTANTRWVEQLLALALELAPGSPPLIQSVLGGGKWEDKKTLFRDSLGPWVERAAKAGVRLAVKPHRGHAMSRPAEAIWLIEQLDAADTLSLVYDHSHFIFRDMPIAETVDQALPYTGYLVMKDAVMQDGKVRFALPGEAGTIPHAEILARFLAGGYRGEVCSEVSSQVWRQEGYDPKQAARTCFQNLSRIVADAQKPRSQKTRTPKTVHSSKTP